MLRCIAVASGMMIGGLAFAAQQVSASPMRPGSQQSLHAEAVVEKVGRRHHCARWYRECHGRYGGGRRFLHCMAQHGC